MNKFRLPNTNHQSLIALLFSIIMLASCTPEAKWETDDVIVKMNIGTISAGFIECNFSTNKEAYYLIACRPV